MPTKIYDQFDVVKVPFPFTDIRSRKVRPALILSPAKNFNNQVDASIVAMITSFKPDRESWPFDMEIIHLKSAGLPVRSIIRMKLFTLDHRLILKQLGSLAGQDRESF
jgi:mRNA interferase MazF